MDYLRLILGFQGVYYLVTGIWPVLHMPSFLFVTGPKAEVWLVEMVGLLAAAIGLAVLVAVKRRSMPVEVVVVAVAAGAAFFYIDVRYYVSGRLTWVYLADSAVQLLLIILVCGMAWRNRPQSSGG